MSLNLSEKEYWKGRITSILEKKRDEALAAKGTSMKEIALEAEDALRVKAGVDKISDDIEILEAEKNRINAEIEVHKNERNVRWLQFAKKEKLEDVSTYRPVSDIKRQLMPREERLTALSLGVEDEFLASSDLKQELMDAIMISTTSTKLKNFVEKVLDKHGVSDSNGLRALVDF